MKIIKVTQDDFNEWLELSLKLWSDNSIEEMQETLTDILQSSREAGFIVKNNDGKAIGFMNLSLRYEYVPGATQNPVAYVEGIYIEEEYRRQGVGRYLIKFAQQWGLEHGCIELASDALLENTESYEFHTSVGFQEVERVVTFIKPIIYDG
ncbi:aminoglycoside 6'-N-acetyltransferase [Calothrix sp. NIES-3974]|uniref:aminoglycoside 6'-N-acetyltransferase n=1 Tax=Calothrix sp. NIES-3974 TaxID=2005462 RepID=UPI000B615020|nr:aminoglycoside 6'-N-acetyltransferase [Calothrix sp. NIES-3974]BAZ06606.1 GCN5-related N-acetyltransferase [Calothrix sp. NIES-3974]